MRGTSRAVRTFGVRPVRIGPARLADENLRFSGRNMMRRVLHGTRRIDRSVHRRSRAVRTFGVRPVRIGPARLAHQNPRFSGRGLVLRVE